MDPTVELLTVPADYGTPRRMLAWADVSRRLTEAPQYWLTTVRPDGRPHVVPTDGVWMDQALYLGGSTDSVHYRNLGRTASVVVHLEDAMRAVIVEGVAEPVTPGRELARRLARESNAKTGYGAPVAMFQAPMWRIRPVRVLAWTSFPTDATRFRFGREPQAQGGGCLSPPRLTLR
ncbi:MAG: pyridoxamine 5'-phosphate oxidase family protein [Actinomycetes bacterium]